MLPSEQLVLLSEQPVLYLKQGVLSPGEHGPTLTTATTLVVWIGEDIDSCLAQ